MSMAKRIRRANAVVPCLAATFVFGCGSAPAETATESLEDIGQVSQAMVASPKKIAYYPAWVSATTPEPLAALPWSKMTHVIASFVGISRKEPAYGDKYQCRFWTDYNMQDIEDTQARDNAQALINYRNSLPSTDPGRNVKVMVAIGGWTLSYRFSDALNTATDRNDLADSCVSLVKNMGFDGLDIDWEYPTRLGPTSGAGSCRSGWTCARSTDPANLTAWLDVLRSKTDFNGKLLTMAVRANRSGDAQNIPYEYGNFFTGSPRRLDLLNVMTYDFHGSWESTTNYGAPFSKATEAINYASSQVGSSHKARIVLGIPFYGPRWTNVASDAVGAAGNMGAEPISYRSARLNYVGQSGCGIYGTTSDRRIWCSGTTNGDAKPWISYDDETVVGSKAQWVADNNFGGAMWWAAGQDYNNALANAIDAKLPTVARVFDNGDNNVASPNEWDSGYYKGDCGSGSVVIGLSQHPDLSAAHAILCAPNSTFSGNYVATVTDVSNGDHRRAARAGDWDSGYYKSECGFNEYVSGISMQPSTKKVHGLRCASATLANGGMDFCETRLVNQDDRGSTTFGDWDHGYYKAQCGPDKVVFGVSTVPATGKPHRILCCNY